MSTVARGRGGKCPACIHVCSGRCQPLGYIVQHFSSAFSGFVSRFGMIWRVDFKAASCQQRCRLLWQMLLTVWDDVTQRSPISGSVHVLNGSVLAQAYLQVLLACLACLQCLACLLLHRCHPVMFRLLGKFSESPCHVSLACLHACLDTVLPAPFAFAKALRLRHVAYLQISGVQWLRRGIPT